MIVPLLALLVSLGHPDLVEAYRLVNERLEASPTDVEAYFARAGLHVQHGDYDGAMADLGTVLRLDPGRVEAKAAQGRVLLAAGWPRSAVMVLDEFLEEAVESSSEVGGALLTRARAHAATGDLEAADVDYVAARAALPPSPDVAMEHADLWSSSGDAARALAVIDDAMIRQGPLVSLQTMGVSIASGAGLVDDAVARLDRLVASSDHPAPHLLRKAGLLETSERRAPAHEAYEATIEAIDAMPEHRRGTLYFKSIRVKARAGLERTRGGAPTKKGGES